MEWKHVYWGIEECMFRKLVNLKIGDSRHVDAFQLAVGSDHCFVELAFHVLFLHEEGKVHGTFDRSVVKVFCFFQFHSQTVLTSGVHDNMLH